MKMYESQKQHNQQQQPRAVIDPWEISWMCAQEQQKS